MTTADVARRYRVSEDKVRGWITRGELKAVNTSATLAGKPRYVVPPEALADFERRRDAAPAQPRLGRPRRSTRVVDFYPD